MALKVEVADDWSDATQKLKGNKQRQHKRDDHEKFFKISTKFSMFSALFSGAGPDTHKKKESKTSRSVGSQIFSFLRYLAPKKKTKNQNHGGQRSIRSIARSVDPAIDIQTANRTKFFFKTCFWSPRGAEIFFK